MTRPSNILPMLAAALAMTQPAGVALGSPDAKPAPGPAVTASPDLDAIAAIVGRGRYMERPACRGGPAPDGTVGQCCAPVPADSPLFGTTLAPYVAFRLPGDGHQGIQDCRYVDHGIATRVLMLNPTPRRVAEWTESACRDAKALSMIACAKWAWEKVWSASGTQFAIAGIIVEDPKGKCWAGDAKPAFVGYTFRDGVTVEQQGIGGVCDTDAKRLADPAAYVERAVLHTTSGGPSRVTMMTRQAFAGDFHVPVPSSLPIAGQIGWLKQVREIHMQALRSPSHPWLELIVNQNLPKSLRKT